MILLYFRVVRLDKVLTFWILVLKVNEKQDDSSWIIDVVSFTLQIRTAVDVRNVCALYCIIVFSILNLVLDTQQSI